MGGGYLSYSKLRESNVPWLGQIPVHWGIERARHLFEEQNREVRGSDGVVTAFRDGQVCLRSRRRSAGYTMAILEHGYQGIRRGDLVIHAMDAFAGAIGISEDDGKATPEYVVVTPFDAETQSRYFANILRVMAARDYIFVLCPSVRERAPRFRFVRFQQALLPIPPPEEQGQIVKFLDYETAKIDALIEKQQQLIALLKEKRQAVISHAVTKGLNPDAPMRDSGVEWLGKVPAHWVVLNLNRVVRTFVDYRGRTPEKTDEGRPLVTAGAVRNGIVDLDRAPQFVSEETYHLLRQRGEPEQGDLLFTSEAPLGEVAIVEDVEIACAQRIIMFKLDRTRIKPQFMWLYLRSQAGQDEILTKASGSTAEGIRADRLRRCRVLVPALEEQARIVTHVANELSGFDEILQKASEQTELLRERRTALISAAVTGKIDLRNWKVPETRRASGDHMSADAREAAFQRDIINQMIKGGWKLGDPSDYNRERALYTSDCLDYVQKTQARTWDKYTKLYPGNPEKAFLDLLSAQLNKVDPRASDKSLRTFGTLGVLRHELRDRSASFKLCQFKPEHGLNPDVQAMYDGNILRVVPELVYSPYATQAHLDETGTKAKAWRIDLVLFLNGVPIVTMELKSEFKQAVQNAIKQYKKTRLPKDPETNKPEPLLTFKRGALVHFAVSQDEVHMTTKLEGMATGFLPFNQGQGTGAKGTTRLMISTPTPPGTCGTKC